MAANMYWKAVTMLHRNERDLNGKTSLAKIDGMLPMANRVVKFMIKIMASAK